MQDRVIAPGALSDLSGLLDRLAPEGRVVVLGGPHSFASGPAERVISSLTRPVTVKLLPGALPDTESLANLHREEPEPPACLVAIGGGRVLDLAKLYATGEREIEALVADIDAGHSPARKVPLIAVPTTAGSGSESTPFAVLYHKGRKLSADHPSLLPDIALVDADLSRDASRRVRASSGLDALCQAIESLLSRRRTDESADYARTAISATLKTLQPALDGDPQASAGLAEAANTAGRAIAITRTTVPHALSYALTSGHGLAHGHAVALSMGPYLAHMGAQIATDAGLAPWATSYRWVLDALGASGPQDVAAVWHRLVAETGLEPDIAACGLPEDARRVAAETVNPARLGNAPLTLDTETLARLIA